MEIWWYIHPMFLRVIHWQGTRILMQCILWIILGRRRTSSGGWKTMSKLWFLGYLGNKVIVTNDKIISVVVNHFKDLDRFYVDRLLPLLARNPRTGEFEQVYVINRQHGDCFIAVTDIHNDGMCNPSIMTAFAVSDADREIKQRTMSMLHLLGY